MLFAISNTLRAYLESRFPDSSGPWVTIASRQKDDAATFPPNKLALLLYAVSENTYLRNQGLRATEQGFVAAPVAVTLYYLITYTSSDAEQLQRRLSLVLQAFESSLQIGPPDLDPELVGRVEHLSLRLRALAPEELNRIWTGLSLGMRLALYYEVDAALIEPLEPKTEGPVLQRRIQTLPEVPV
jgi:hypothetical protein